MSGTTLTVLFCVFPHVLKIFTCVPFGAWQVSGGCEVSGTTVYDSFCIINHPVHCSMKFNTLSSPLSRNGIYPLMNFASSRPHPVPRALSLSQEQVETVKTPTPEPQETESRKARLSDVTKKVLLSNMCQICFQRGLESVVVLVAYVKYVTGHACVCVHVCLLSPQKY